MICIECEKPFSGVYGDSYCPECWTGKAQPASGCGVMRGRRDPYNKEESE